jgi:hydrogenase maturation protease
MVTHSKSRNFHPLLSPDQGKEAGVHKRTLVIGYGNLDRQDDGVAWHILKAVLKTLGYPIVDPFENPLIEYSGELTLLFTLQLTPELAEMISEFDRVCFVDAHTGAIPDPVHIEILKSEFSTSPFTHHLTPSACLHLAQTLFNKNPEGLLVSVQGYEFGFSQFLSPTTARLAEEAAKKIVEWITN